MNNTEFLNFLEAKFPSTVLNSAETYNMLTVEVARENVIPLLKSLKDDKEVAMDFLTDLCGVHYPENTGKELGVVYHVHSFTKNIRLRIKTFFSIDDAKIPTATDVYSAANWMERETYDFFGIIFEGHPDLRRILNVDEMDYFPLRKEYRLEDGTRTDKDDRYFGRQGHEGIEFTKRVDRC